jgi:hypothetical protein
MDITRAQRRMSQCRTESPRSIFHADLDGLLTASPVQVPMRVVRRREV